MGHYRFQYNSICILILILFVGVGIVVAANVIIEIYGTENNGNNTSSVPPTTSKLTRRTHSRDLNTNQIFLYDIDSNNPDNNDNDDDDGNDDDDDDDDGFDDWETTYDANVTTISGVPLLNVQTIQVVLVTQQVDITSNVSTSSLQRTLSTTTLSDDNIVVEDTSEDVTIINVSRATEIFYRYGASFRQTTKRKETIWRGYLRFPTLITDGSISTTTTIDGSYVENYMLHDASTSYRTGFCTVYEIDGRIHAATFTTESDVYDLFFYNDKYEIRSSRWIDFPPQDNYEDDNSTFPESLVHNNRREQHSSLLAVVDTSTDNKIVDKSSNLGNYVAIQPENYIDWVTHECSVENDGTLQNQTRSRLLQNKTNTIVDVLIIVSNRALCEYIGLYNNGTVKTCPITTKNRAPMDARIQLSVSETNTAMLPVNVQIRVVLVVYMNESSTFDPISTRDGLNSISNSAEIQNLRTKTGADLVSVIAGRGGNCGLAIISGYRSINNQACLKQYVFTHELGHNFGCNHNREAFGPDDKQHEYAHGLIVHPTYRTFLSYECTTVPYCPRVPYFSSAFQKLPDGRTLGNATTDNLRMIQQAAPRMIQWKHPPTAIPSRLPTKKPIRIPTRSPTTRPILPTRLPTKTPQRKPSFQPRSPTKRPFLPTRSPTNAPQRKPSFQPRSPTTRPILPTRLPTNAPQRKPSFQPRSPTNRPILPTREPSFKPISPTMRPFLPTRSPTNVPHQIPSFQPTLNPTNFSTRKPTFQPTTAPTSKPTLFPTKLSTSGNPTFNLTNVPTTKTSSSPINSPTTTVTLTPTNSLTRIPATTTLAPTNLPTTTPLIPTNSLTAIPAPKVTSNPTNNLSTSPSKSNTSRPTMLTNFPNRKRTSEPTSSLPSKIPTTRTPSFQPSGHPSMSPILPSTRQPLNRPSVHPSNVPTIKPTTSLTIRPISIPVELNPSTGQIPKCRSPCTNNPSRDSIQMYRFSIFSGRCIQRCLLQTQYSYYKRMGFKCGLCTHSMK